MASASPTELLKLAQAQSGGGFETGQGGGGGIMDLIAGVMEEKKKSREKKLNDQMDMYQTLRDAGYDPKSAFEATEKGSFPTAPGGATVKERNADILDRNTTTQKILKKVADGVDLLPGEQKVYDDYIKKRSTKSEDDGLEDVLSPNKKPAAKEQTPAELLLSTNHQKDDAGEYVPMTDPTGKNKKVHKDDVAKAIKAGWKKR